MQKICLNLKLKGYNLLNSAKFFLLTYMVAQLKRKSKLRVCIQSGKNRRKQKRMSQKVLEMTTIGLNA